MKKVGGLAPRLTLFAVIVLTVLSCQNPLLQSDRADDGAARSISGSAAIFPLWAGKDEEAGTVSVWRDSTTLYVKYETDERFTLEETQVWVGTQIDYLQKKKHGLHGRDAYAWDRDKKEIPDEARVWTAEIPFQTIWESKNLFIFAHAELRAVDRHKRIGAWGGDRTLELKHWKHFQHWGHKKEWMRYMYLVPPSLGGGNGVYSIAGRVFNDIDTDGFQDMDESGLSGVSLTLSNSAGVLATTLSASDGSYFFPNLVADMYTVSSGGKAGFAPTPYYSPITAQSLPVPPGRTEVNFGLSQTPPQKSVSGVAFYDADWDDTYDIGEPLLAGVTIRLKGTDRYEITKQDGSYRFDNLEGATSYTFTADYFEGFVFSVNFEREVNTLDNLPDKADFGFAVDYYWLNGKLAEGKPSDFWKYNLDKAIAGDQANVDVDSFVLNGYLGELADFALAPLGLTSLSQASTILGNTATDIVSKLQKQLLAAEFNYLNGAYIGGNALATYFFVYDGENMFVNPAAFDDAQRDMQRQYYEAYNNSQGGPVVFSNNIPT
ncbi:MAG TPA: SdrD B-like domain-containing protein [Rectinemataceae bacterium]